MLAPLDAATIPQQHAEPRPTDGPPAQQPTEQADPARARDHASGPNRVGEQSADSTRVGEQAVDQSRVREHAEPQAPEPAPASAHPRATLTVEPTESPENAPAPRAAPEPSAAPLPRESFADRAPRAAAPTTSLQIDDAAEPAPVARPAPQHNDQDQQPQQREAPAHQPAPLPPPRDPRAERAPAAARPAEPAPSTEAPAPLAATPKPVVGADTTFAPPRIAEPTPSATAAPPQRTPDADPAAQIVSRGLTAAVNQRGGSVTIRLAPESLGLVRVHLNIDNDAVTARLEASTPQAQRLLTDNLAMLKGSLESRGLTVDRLQVQLAPAPAQPPASSGTQHHTQGGFSGQPGSEQHDAGDAPSRGRDDGERRDEHADRREDAPEHDRRPLDFTRQFRLRLEAVA